MKEIKQTIIKRSRPLRLRGKIDRYLAKIASDLRRVILRAQEEHGYSFLNLEPEQASHLASTCVEFAEDLHCENGLWMALESYNLDFFQTPLPFLVEPNSSAELELFDVKRVQHFLWRMFISLLENDDQITLLNPCHPGVKLIAEVISKFLTKQFARLPKDSSIKQLLESDNTHAFDVKKKLFWLAAQSYLFRYDFQRYQSESNNPESIATADDFVCQYCSSWSGLGTLEFMVEAIGLEGNDRKDLLSWSERLYGGYRIVKCVRVERTVESIEAKNIVTGQIYNVFMDLKTDKFHEDDLIYGALTPWRGRWYWSGEQRSLSNTSETEKFVSEQLQSVSPQLICRASPERAELTRKTAELHHQAFLEFYGNDLSSFPDGLTLAASEKKRCMADWDKTSESEILKTMEKHGLKKPEPNMAFPDKLLAEEDGVGVFSDPVEGINYLSYFYDLKSGLEANGKNLSVDEREILFGLLKSNVIPPSCVRRLTDEFGGESIAEIFMFRNQPADLVLEYLLRSYKGEFFRNRHPKISFR